MPTQHLSLHAAKAALDAHRADSADFGVAWRRWRAAAAAAAAGRSVAAGLLLWLAPTAATAASVCDYPSFRDAMAPQRSAEVDALISSCRQRQHWPEREDGASLLNLAAHVGAQQAAAETRALLGAGVDVTNDAGLTPLHAAAPANLLARVDALPAAGADPAKRTTRDTHWRLGGLSRSFGLGLPVARGSTA